MRLIMGLIFCLVLMVGCSSKAYIFEGGDQSNAKISVNALTGSVEATMSGEHRMCAVPKDAPELKDLCTK